MINVVVSLHISFFETQSPGFMGSFVRITVSKGMQPAFLNELSNHAEGVCVL